MEKYGLVWEDHEEKNIPSKLVKVKELIGRPESDDNNLLIEGDNLHSLTLLEETHTGKVDVIYIDPPYNVGQKDVNYTDTFRAKEDVYAHSKWLSFMEKRLKIARKLLSETGVVFISIDDKEVYPLKLLCDEIFGENAFVSNIIWQKKSGAADAKGIATITEYILVYVKDANNLDAIFDVNYNSPNMARYKYKDEYYETRGIFYYDYLDRGSLKYSDSLNYPIQTPDGTDIYPNGRSSYKNDGWTWKWSREKLKWGMENGFVRIVPSKNKPCGWAVQYKIYLNVDNEGNPVEKSAPFKNIITQVSNANAAADIKNIFDGVMVFKYSKPVELIKILLSMVRNKNGVVLDFFAGSGTTGQAVLEQNAKDNSNRTFILCTNNENNICETITFKRMERVIFGYRYYGKKTDVLYEKTLTIKDIYSMDTILAILEDLERDNKEKYGKIRKELKQGILRLAGENIHKGHMDGIPANLIYYRVEPL